MRITSYTSEINNILIEFLNTNFMAKFLNTPQARESIRQSLFSQKVVQQLVEIAKGAKLSEAEPKEEKK